jgi:hypothetical protein
MIEEVIDERVALLPKGIRSTAKKLLRKELTAASAARVGKWYLPAKAKQEVPTFGREFQERAGQRIGILSLSEVSTDLLMWAHYGDHHRGLVLEFDCTNEFFVRRMARGALGRLMKVVYTDKRPAITAFDQSIDPKVHYGGLIRDLLLTKGNEWSYEHEWRMVLPLDDLAGYPHDIKDNIHLFSLPAESVTAVILGARATSDTKTALQNIIAASADLAHIHLKHCRTSDTEYAVKVHDGSR